MSPQQSAAEVLPIEAPLMSAPPAELTFHVEGVLNGVTATELRNKVEAEACDPGSGQAPHIVIDFSRVRESYDFGISVLAHWLGQRGNARPKVHLRGLRTHQMRMFHYFGIDSDSDS